MERSQGKENTKSKSQRKTKAKTEKGTHTKLDAYMYCGENVLSVVSTSFMLNVVVNVLEFMLNI